MVFCWQGQKSNRNSFGFAVLMSIVSKQGSQTAKGISSQQDYRRTTVETQAEYPLPRRRGVPPDFTPGPVVGT